MSAPWHIPRRTFLRGFGTVLALPMLEAMVPPVRALAAASGNDGREFPLRMAFCYVPNGKNMEKWTPETEGAGFEFTPTLEPLKPFKDDLLVLTGLTQDKARSHGDGGGDHARASATFLTGCQARKTNGADIKIGVSVDQIAAEKLGKFTRLPSLELSCDRGQQTGNCDSGYSCAYQFNLAWKNEALPMVPETDPRQVFERLFGNSVKGEAAESRARRERYHKSVLDFVSEDARQLKSKLGATDQRKLDEYLSAVREMEQRIERAEQFATTLPDYKQPTGVPKDYEQHLHLMSDLLVLAFQSDATRVSTFLFAHDGSNRSYPSLGVSDGHHTISHHQKDPEKLDKLARINKFHVTQFAYLVEKLKSIKEGDGTLLDNCMVVYGAGISDGNRHNHDNLPILLAGHGRGTIKTGRHVVYPKETPMTNLFLSMLDRYNIHAERLGDSTGKLADLT